MNAASAETQALALAGCFRNSRDWWPRSRRHHLQNQTCRANEARLVCLGPRWLFALLSRILSVDGGKGVNSAQLTEKTPRQRPDRPQRRRKSVLSPVIIGCVGGLLTAFSVVGVAVPIKSPKNVLPSHHTLTGVEAAERAAAVGTFNPYFRQQLGEADDKCPAPLAEVTVLMPTGASPGMVQIRSGSYISPPFKVTHSPQRIAIPFPAEYSTGRGTISVLGTADVVFVALDPIWHVSPLLGVAEQLVVWTPHKVC